MITLSELLNQLEFITGELAVLGLFTTAGLIVLVKDWRITLLALLGQYLMAGLILSRLVSPEIALVKVLIGALICPMLYLAARHSTWNTRSQSTGAAEGRSWWQKDNASDVFSVNFAFRVLAVTLVLLVTIMVSQTYPLPKLPPDVGMGSYWLILSGLLVLVLTEEPIKAGPGLLTAITGFELLYTPLERSLILVWLWAVANLLLSLAIAYLTVIRGLGRMERGS